MEQFYPHPISQSPDYTNDAGRRSQMILGEVASSGLAFGDAFVCACYDSVAIENRPVRCEDSTEDAAQEVARFENAVALVQKDLLQLQEEVSRGIGAKEASIFEAQSLILKDPQLRDSIVRGIANRHAIAENAVDAAFEKFILAFGSIIDPTIRERVADLRETRDRLLRAFKNEQTPEVPVMPLNSILVAPELLSFIVARLNMQNVRGLITEQGGQTAHATILARARKVPLVIHVANATKRIRNGDKIIIDGLAGRVFVNPDSEIRREYEQLENAFRRHLSAQKKLIPRPAQTADGVSIKLSANIGKSADAVMSASVNADGAGLYRTEFVFQVQDRFPSEDEQHQIYCATAEKLKPHAVVVRVLDIGSDKMLPYFRFPPEANPSLGRRGIRFLLAHPEVFHGQLRAILRASAVHPVSLLFPMVSGMEDVQAIQAAIQKAKSSLREQGVAFNEKIPLGMMIETPAAAILASQFAEAADFLSIGTNDLVQYLLTTDRTSSAVAAYYEPLHPAVLRVLASVITAAKEKAKPISICGEMAGNSALTQLLIGFGLRSFSVNPGELLDVKEAISLVRLPRAEDLARTVLELSTVQQIKDCLRASSLRAPLQVAP